MRFHPARFSDRTTACPLSAVSDFWGFERAIMKSVVDITKMQDLDGETWDVRLLLDGASHPLVSITTEKSPKHTYLAATFVGLGGRSDGFRIAPSWDEPFIEFDHAQWLPACIAVRNAIPAGYGELDVRWIPSDPSLPF